MSDYVIPEVKATEAEMISIRHYLHANPELSLEEFNTSAACPLPERSGETGADKRAGARGGEKDCLAPVRCAA